MTPHLPDALFLALATTLDATGLDDDGDSNIPVFLVAPACWWAASYTAGVVLVLAVEGPNPGPTGMVERCVASRTEEWRAICLANIPQAPRAELVAAIQKHRPVAWSNPTPAEA